MPFHVTSRPCFRLVRRSIVEGGPGLRTAQQLLRQGRECNTSPFHDSRMDRGVIGLEPTVEMELTSSEIMEGRFPDPVYRV